MMRVFGLLIWLFALAGPIRSAEWSEVPLQRATLRIDWHEDSLRELRLAIPRTQSLPLSPSPKLRLVLRAGQSVEFRGGDFLATDSWSFVLRGRHHQVERPTLAVVGGRGFEFTLKDTDGREWLRFDHAHPQARSDGVGAEWRHFDVRVGLALAKRLGDERLKGVPLGSAALIAETTVPTKTVASCTSPNFPTTGNFQVDVALTAIDSADAVCDGACDGTGATSARVKLTPSTKLQGVGTADVPWYRMFTVSPYDYPYPGNDQHPYLVWAAYRIDADGRLQQLARSGVKHAFFAINEFPSGGGGCGCGPANILWAGCSDTYGWSTNDSSAWLSARSEVVPASGQWGRCGSLRDADCNGSDDSPSISSFDLRAVVAESDLVPSQHPGAQWFIEAWYVVRDDIDVVNSFGHRRIAPHWVSAIGKWLLDFSETEGGPQWPFVSGPVIDAWVAPGTMTTTAYSQDVADAHGRLRLAVRTTDLGDGRWRYDYALMNFDHTVATLRGSEPNLRVLANEGPVAFALPLSSFAIATTSLRDGDLDPGNDWKVERDAAQLRFVAPTETSMPWGALFAFRLEVNLPPTSGIASIQPVGDSESAPLTVATLVPDASVILFADGLEE